MMLFMLKSVTVLVEVCNGLFSWDSDWFASRSVSVGIDRMDDLVMDQMTAINVIAALVGWIMGIGIGVAIIYWWTNRS
jgi:hypothetical protein